MLFIIAEHYIELETVQCFWLVGLYTPTKLLLGN